MRETMSKNICKTCGRVLEAGEVHAKDSSGKCVTRIIARSVPANAVVTAEEGEQVTLDVRPLTSLATAVKMLHWNADTTTTEHGALGELYEALEAATDRFVEAWMGKNKGAVVSEETLELKDKSFTEVLDEAAKAVEGYRQKVGADCEDLLNILADMDEALNKARYLLKAKGEDMSEQAKVTAAGTDKNRELLALLRASMAGNEEAKAELFSKMGFAWPDAVLSCQDSSSCSVIHCKDESFAVKAKKVWATGQPTEFQWMPGGTRTITASYGRGKQNVPIELTVLADAEAAKAVQASFEAIKGANPRRPPYGCIEHRAEERAFEPLRFSWKDDPEPAIYCECEPSELGARNVNGKIHTSFSPTFDTDAEYGKLECSGCGEGLGKCACSEKHVFRFKTGARGSAANPARVTRLDAQSVGSLTNWPAFKDILPVAASEPQGLIYDRDGVAVGSPLYGELHKINASGTSEGAKKGWEHRSAIAKEKTAIAHASGKAEDHEAARKAHIAAFEAVQDHSNSLPEGKEKDDLWEGPAHYHSSQGYEHMRVASGMTTHEKYMKDHMLASDLTPLTSLHARVDAAAAAEAAVKARLTLEQRMVGEGRVECGAPIGNKNASGPHKGTASWTPKSREDIAGKEHLYKTARIKKTGEFVELHGHKDGMFFTRGYAGNSKHDWTELDSYTL